MKEKIWSIKYRFIKKNLWSQQCAAHREDHFVIKCLVEIETEFKNTFSQFIRGPNGVESWKKWRSKIPWHTPFKVNQRLTKISILNIQCAVYLFSVMHTTELDSAVQCAPQSWTPRCDAHCRAWLCGVMHTPELDYAVGCTLRSQTSSNMSVFRVFVFVTPFDSVFRQTAHCGVKIEIFESLVAFKGTIRRNPFRGEHIYHERKDLKTKYFIC